MAAISSRRPRVARVLLRLPADLHRSLAKAAAAAGLSFNEFCVRRLSAPAPPAESSATRMQVVGRARAALGDALLGVIVLGSWARGDAASGSDLDVLLVVAPSLPLTRDLYRTWDASPLEVEGRVVDPHFVHLPAPGALPSAVWCEAAVDGLVWADRDGRIERTLADVRRAIAAGRLVRAFANGQPYWKGAT